MAPFSAATTPRSARTSATSTSPNRKLESSSAAEPLHLYGPHLAEIRSIVVKPEAKGQGAGGKLIKALLAESEEQAVACVSLFTRIPDFFFHFGFRVADRTALPDKIYKDCQACPRLYACDEVAMVRGPLPKMAVLGPSRLPQPELVKLQTGTIHHS